MVYYIQNNDSNTINKFLVINMIKMATTFSCTIGLLYTPPSAQANSGNATLQIQGSASGQNVGQVDIAAATAPATVIPIPFGALASAKLFLIKNMMSSEIGVRINGHVTNDFNVPVGGVVMYAAPSAPSLVPFTLASIVTTGTPSVTESVLYWTFGD